MFHVEHFLSLCYNTGKGVNKMETNENNNEVLSVLNDLLEKVTTLETSFKDFTSLKEETEDVAEETVEEVAEEVPEVTEEVAEETVEEISDEEVDELAELLY